MPTFVFTSPEGMEYEIDGPEGSTEQEAFGVLQSQLGSGSSQPANIPGQRNTVGEDFPRYAEGTFASKVWPAVQVAGEYGLGVAKGLQDVKGTLDQAAAKIWSPLLPEAEKQVTESNKAINNIYKSALNDSSAAAIGRIAGQTTGTLPTMALSPLRGAGLVSAVGNAGIQGAASGALTSSASDEPLLQQIADQGAFGAGFGGALYGAGKLVAPFTKAGQDMIAAQLMAAKPETKSAIQQVKDYFSEAFSGAKVNKNAAELAQQLRGAEELVPGSVPTAGQAASGTRLPAIEKRLASISPEDFDMRQAEQIAARAKAFNEIAGDQSRVSSAVDNRASQTTPLREAAFNEGRADSSFFGESALPDYSRPPSSANQNISGLQRFVNQYGEEQWVAPKNDNFKVRLDELKKSSSAPSLKPESQFFDFLSANQQRGVKKTPIPTINLTRPLGDALSSAEAKQEVVGDALSWLKSRLANASAPLKDKVYNTATGLEGISPEALYSIRKDINFAIDGKLGGANSDKSQFRLASSQLINMRNLIDNEIEKVAPGFKDYLSKYAELSKPISQMKLLQGIREGAETGIPERISGEDPLSLVKLKNQVRNNRAEIDKILTEDQRKKLNAIIADMEREASSSRVTAVPRQQLEDLGAKNLLGIVGREGSLRETLAGAPIVKKIPGFLYGHLDTPIQQRMTSAMLDNKLAAEILDRLAASNVALGDKQRAALTAALSANNVSRK